MQFINQIRFYHYISGVCLKQQNDPLCIKCSAYVNTVSALKNSLAEIESSHQDKLFSCTGETRHLLEEARRTITSITTEENSSGQKKAGNCKMPQGVCFIKSSKKILISLE